MATGNPHPHRFLERHLGPTEAEQRRMLDTIGAASLEQLVAETVPAAIRRSPLASLPPAHSEHAALARLRELLAGNRVQKSFIGMGYHGTVLPPVIQRAVLENPGWYTQYTPYQAEISQGRLECLFHFQTLVAELTGLPVANASLLDEATAAAEAVHLGQAMAGEGRDSVLADPALHPQVIGVLKTRAEVLGIRIRVQDPATADLAGVFLAIIAYPGTDGHLADPRPAIARAQAAGALAALDCDPLALCLLASPGSLGADIAFGSAQRFGVPLGFGGPHAAFFAVKDACKRHIPGRIVGLSRDRHGRPAYRLSLQTREQHIRREKATSNICTAQALLANMAALYAIWHGSEGLVGIASQVHGLAMSLAAGCRRLGLTVRHGSYFDTVAVQVADAERCCRAAADIGINLRRLDAGTIAIALDETAEAKDLASIWQVLNDGRPAGFAPADLDPGSAIPAGLARSGAFLDLPIFRSIRCEHDMLRHIKRLEARDLSLTSSMIPLGSCTMKLNPAATMLPLSWAELTAIHPYAPPAQAEGYRRMLGELSSWLAGITELPGVSLQPNAGSQGEYAGLLAIRAYQQAQGQGHRDACLIPVSAHGTNPASAAMCGLRVVPVACDSRGDIDLADLQAKAAAHAKDLCCLMVTYPSTHGVFEEGIQEACRIVHRAGGQVYMDGANMNAQVGLTSPGRIGADVCHLNLHKTFAIPHGGGGPGMGPICVAAHLTPHLPGDPVSGKGAVSAAPNGSASILMISWMYCLLMGDEGLTRATQVAILNANYIARRLAPHFPVLFAGNKGRVAHECILDLRGFKAAGVEAEDVAKRLMDYGFHAPTLSFPVVGTLMIEPTESEPLAELDRFCEAMISIRGEIQAVADGRLDRQDNPLKQAPHTAEECTGDTWTHPYPRSQAAWPLDWIHGRKFWPSVGRVDSAWGDRNLVCTCPPVTAYS